jgi:hypothetical protein
MAQTLSTVWILRQASLHAGKFKKAIASQTTHVGRMSLDHRRSNGPSTPAAVRELTPVHQRLSIVDGVIEA